MKNHLALVGTGYTISVTPEAIELKKSLLEAASKIKSVADDLGADLARDVLRQLADFRNRLESTRKNVKEPVIKLGKEIDAKALSFGSDASSEESRVMGLIKQYALKQEQERQRIQAEADRLRREAQEQERKAQEEFERAEKLKTRAATAKAEEKAQETMMVASMKRMDAERSEEKAAEVKAPDGTKQEIEFSVSDIHALYESHPELVKLEPRTAEIKRHLKSLQDAGKEITIPGVTVTMGIRVSTR